MTVKEARAREGKETLIAVAGCVAQAEGAEIVRRASAVDVVVGPQSYHRLPELLARARSGEAIIETEFPEEDKFAVLPQQRAPKAATAFLTVQEGCDKFCTFCVVPYTRGMEYSRSVAALADEARRLVERGVREITLLGQNVNAYHGEGPDGKAWPLASLIRHLAEIDGLARLRYTTSHPRDMSDDLIAAHRDEAKLMPYLHLPFQSGADRILAAMNRKHTADDYRRLIARIRDARPDIALSTDVIVGFPGETEGEFEETLNLVREIGFAQAYSFKYSARPGTPAANLPGQIDEGVNPSGCSACKSCSNRTRRDSTRRASGRYFPCFLKSLGAAPVSWWAGLLICKPFTPRRGRPCSAVWCRLKSGRQAQIACPVSSQLHKMPVNQL